MDIRLWKERAIFFVAAWIVFVIPGTMLWLITKRLLVSHPLPFWGSVGEALIVTSIPIAVVAFTKPPSNE